MARSLVYLAVAAAALSLVAPASAFQCPADPFSCSMKDAEDEASMRSCMCGKMIWVLGSYHPAPMAGVNALSTVCGWWQMQKLLPEDEEASMKALGVCQQMSVTVSTAALSSPYGWMGAQNLCCQIYASEGSGSGSGSDSTSDSDSSKSSDKTSSPNKNLPKR